MKAFISIKYHADMRNRAHIEDVARALEGNGCETMCIVRDVERWGELKYDARDLMRQTFASIRLCDVLVVDASEKGVGIGIEAGYARAMNKSVWVIARSGSDISETLRGIADAVRTFEDSGELGQIFRDLKAAFR
jgi:nucleoside 2-deoxyribosyltransferase